MRRRGVHFAGEGIAEARGANVEGHGATHSGIRGAIHLTIPSAPIGENPS
jgi:hypothetical protein